MHEASIVPLCSSAGEYLFEPGSDVRRVRTSVVFLEPSRLLAYEYYKSRNHLPMAASRAFVEDSAALIRSTCLDITKLQLAIVAFGTGLWCCGPGISILGSQDLHVRALVEKARRECIRGTGSLLRGGPFV